MIVHDMPVNVLQLTEGQKLAEPVGHLKHSKDHMYKFEQIPTCLLDYHFEEKDLQKHALPFDLNLFELNTSEQARTGSFRGSE
jgi:hypothetical protein